jgi:hypothetical protein
MSDRSLCGLGLLFGIGIVVGNLKEDILKYLSSLELLI